MLPAEILLISQTRSPSRSPPKAKTNGKSGQQAAQKRTPWEGRRKKDDDFFLKYHPKPNSSSKNTFSKQVLTNVSSLEFPEMYFVKTEN